MCVLTLSQGQDLWSHCWCSMGCNSFYASLILVSFLIFQSFSSPPGLELPSSTLDTCGCAPPPPPPPPEECPPPPPPLNEKLTESLRVIHDLKNLIQQDPYNDPQNITSDWDGPDPCNYTGFVCSPNPSYDFQLTISDVQFNGFDLKAPLAGFLDKLVDVSIFHANSNRFYGNVPSEIGTSNLPFLFELDLSNNEFDGPFPVSVLQAANLTFLDLRFNSFSGAVPNQVFTLDVDVLFINNNLFVQRLPGDLGSTPALYLTFANNMFTGSIPSTIGQAQDTLLEVLFLNNRLTGCLPWEIGLLKLARVFDASNNELYGPIPSAFACLENMEILNLGSNHLHGCVPEEVCELPQLTNFTLRDNYFTVVGPKCMSLIDNGVLDIGMNCIKDLPDQRPQHECAHPPGCRCRCPDQYLHVPCEAARGDLQGQGRQNRRRAAEVGPGFSVTYGALNHPV